MKPQKAKHLHLEMEKKTPNINHEYYVFRKYDGWYGYMDTGHTIRSRNMREVPSLIQLSKSIELPPHTRLIFEVMVEGVFDFPTLNGMLNRHETCSKAYLKCHDILGLDTNKSFYGRYVELKSYVLDSINARLQLAQLLGYSGRPEHWQKLANEAWARGEEGVILKQSDAPYQPGKRNSSLMKIKEELTIDAEVMGMFEGEGKYMGTLGGLVVREAGGATHNISGMTDGQRDQWWHNPSMIMGLVVEVKAMKRIANGKLREPRFKAIRYDRTKVTD